MDLTERKKKILRAVVESYIRTAEPVGSKAILELADLKVSSATIRNELSDLTEMGYLEQPHTSAGRVPSPKGYRLYVNELMEEQRLSLEETKQINDALHLKMQELDKVIDQAGRMVSQLTNYPAFALAGERRRTTIRRYDLIMVDTNSFIVVVMTDSNVVKNKLIRLPTDLSQPQQELGGADPRTDAGGRTRGRQCLWPHLLGGVLCHGGAGRPGARPGVHRRSQPHFRPPGVPGRGQSPEAHELPQ